MKKPKKILVLGSGALKIGEAGEFDYSGSQGLKALKEEGVRSILVNPNIATIQTSPMLADEIYFLPVTPEFVEKVIAKERPDGILLSFGGQTALNCGLALAEKGILKKYGVFVLGTPVSALELTEDRKKFARHLKRLGIPVPPSGAATTLAEAKKVARAVGFPLMIRAAFALGGQKSGVASNMPELEKLVEAALAVSPQVLVEKYLRHFKEIEYEVVRDQADNCVTICNMENMDPLGIHTGESIVVAPSQTLNNTEYQGLREASLKIVRSLGIVGECNVQFALNPDPGEGELDYYVIEVNARLSRSSALASKATGYPLAYVAAKLALGKHLREIPNQISKTTTSFFEPAMDYVVIKMPRWDLDKFDGAEERIGSAMKSVGEVMAIGRTFEEAIQKGARMLDSGLELTDMEPVPDELLSTPTPKRVFALVAALRRGVAVSSLSELTGIDPWFLHRLKNIVEMQRDLCASSLNPGLLLRSKQLGFSDKVISRCQGSETDEVRKLRKRWGIKPSVFQIDTLAGEVPAPTNYCYLTYNGSHDDVKPFGKKGVMVLGSGPYHIGSSVEFDWSAVHAALALKDMNRKAIVVNCNPETVSTDYDISDRLYFENIDLETVTDIYDFERSEGVIVSVGGQAPNNLSGSLRLRRMPVLGTSPQDIGRAESRSSFSKLCDRLHISQPDWISASTLEVARSFARAKGYPVLVRPSYVLSGSAMRVCADDSELEEFLKKAMVVSKEHPVTISKFMEGAKEIEMDAVAQQGEIVVSAIAEHIEFAGVHSGDATIAYPSQSLLPSEMSDIEEIGKKLARALKVTGPINIQFLVRGGEVSVIEANVRASRTFPLLSKATGINFAKQAVAAFYGKAKRQKLPQPKFILVKSPQFSFSRLAGADPVLRVEMSSTGEAAAFGRNLHEALLSSIIATTSFSSEPKAVLLSLGGREAKLGMLDAAEMLHSAGFRIYATKGTAEFFRQNNVPAREVFKAGEKGGARVLDLIQAKKISFVVNISGIGYERKEGVRTSGYVMRRAAVDHHLPLFTDLNLARAFVSALRRHSPASLPIRSYREWLKG